MDYSSVFLIAISLAADCFAVSVGAGAVQQKLSHLRLLKVAIAFGLAQFLMPIAGWLAGRFIVELITDFDHWIAFALLTIIGGRMIWESFDEKEGIKRETDISRGVLLITMAIATSIDALAVGLSFAFLQINILLASSVIGSVAFLLTIIGFWLGRRVSAVLGKRAKLAGGLILVIIGLRILFDHLR